MSLDTQYYKAKAAGSLTNELINECKAAGYQVTADGFLIATAGVKDAPPAVSKEKAKKIFEGDGEATAKAKRS